MLSRAEVAMAQASNLSENKLKPDSMTLALFYELKGEPERAAAELESYMKKTPQLKNPGRYKMRSSDCVRKPRQAKTTP